MITASHNPPSDNGIKLFDGNGFKFASDVEEEIEALLLDTDISSEHIDNSNIGKAHRIEDARGRYIEFAKNTIKEQSLEGLKIVMDCANGAAYFLGPLIFRELGAKIIKMGTEPDGYNINVGVGALYPDSLANQVVENDADIGIALDGGSFPNQSFEQESES